MFSNSGWKNSSKMPFFGSFRIITKWKTAFFGVRFPLKISMSPPPLPKVRPWVPPIFYGAFWNDDWIDNKNHKFLKSRNNNWTLVTSN